MANWTSIARPYAKAVFEHALQSKALLVWSEWLSQLQTLALSADMLRFIDNPETTVQQHAEVMCDVMSGSAGKDKPLADDLKAFIHTLAESRRLPVLPAIYEQFEALRAEEEHRVSVQVSSFLPLSAEQQKGLIERLTKRLDRKVELQLSVDPELLGGAVISAKDWVINASVKGQLDKLGADLVASSRG